MGASLNRVLLMGNITRDPELRYVPSGTAVTTFDLAVNRVYQAQSGEKKEEVSFIKIVVWARRAEVCAEYLAKGSPVFVEGRLRSRSWQAQDGQKRSTIEVIASNVQFLRMTPKDKKPRESFAGTERQDRKTQESVESIDLNGNPQGNQGEGGSSEEIPF